MSWPMGVKKLLAKYPDGRHVVQFRVCTREGDMMTYEGILSPSTVERPLLAAFNQGLTDAQVATVSPSSVGGEK